MTVLERVRNALVRDLPDIVGGVVRVGTEDMLEEHGIGALEAKEVAFAAGTVAREVVSALREFGGKREEAAVLKIASPPDPAVTPCWFVYAMPVRRHEVEKRVADVAPQVWLSPQSAWIYAEHVAYQDMGIREPPHLVVADEPAVDGENDSLTRAAWELWRHKHRDNKLPIQAQVPFGAYVLGKLPEGGIVAWRSVLTPHGVRAGTLGARADCSLEEPPQVFKTNAAARRALVQRGLPQPIEVFYLPTSLAAELQKDEAGEISRRQPTAHVWPGDPMRVRPERRLGMDPDPVNLRPDWFVSRDGRGGVWAWRPAGDGQVSFARIRDRDGEWKTARWSSVGQCLQHLGALGQFGQEHPTLTVSPGLAVRRPARDHALEPDL